MIKAPFIFFSLLNIRIILSIIFFYTSCCMAVGLGADDIEDAKVAKAPGINVIRTNVHKPNIKCPVGMKHTDPGCWLNNSYKQGLTQEQCSILNGSWKSGCIKEKQ